MSLKHRHLPLILLVISVLPVSVSAQDLDARKGAFAISVHGGLSRRVEESDEFPGKSHTIPVLFIAETVNQPNRYDDSFSFEVRSQYDIRKDTQKGFAVTLGYGIFSSKTDFVWWHKTSRSSTKRIIKQSNILIHSVKAGINQRGRLFVNENIRVGYLLGLELSRAVKTKQENELYLIQNYTTNEQNELVFDSERQHDNTYETIAVFWGTFNTGIEFSISRIPGVKVTLRNDRYIGTPTFVNAKEGVWKFSDVSSIGVSIDV
ncbi:MAG: hypothetical protein HRT74_04095 [Flavobacteriales bacterium]|nr:hypothetical protein [Flavobacteriales bacterium]